MRVLSLEHVPHEGPGRISGWVQERGHELVRRSLAADDELLGQEEFDMLIVMGGPMNIYQHRDYPWLPKEKAFIAEAIQAGKPALGICLGAQLLADVLGGKVMQNAEYEMGWFPVSFSSGERSRLFSDFPTELTVMHWHGDTFSLSPESRLTGSSIACENQAFSWRERVAGLQFHLELDLPMMAQLAEDGFIDQWPGQWVQTADTIVHYPLDYAPLKKALYGLLDRLAEQVVK